MSLVNSLLTAEACLVVCDTQAGTFRAVGPTGFASKVVPIQRLGVLIASTGSGDLFDRWLTHLQLSLGADLDDVLPTQAALLKGTLSALDDQSAHRSSMFIWGWSRQAQRVQGWIMHSRDGFEPVALGDGYTLKPPPSDVAELEAMPATGSSVDRMVEIVARQVADDRKKRARSEYLSMVEGASDPLLLGGDLLAFVLRAPTSPGGSVHIESWTVGPIDGAEQDRLRVLMSGHGNLAVTLHRIRMNRRAERIGRPVALALLWCERAMALLRLRRRR
ncbi:hypothetical protein [Brevundimonas sp.]|uniref:hypothetical protein n=1 Tax=Brevundimonas sp. TaxID=1871086 RepID=UPI0017D5EC7E|nr:hypothetical protein [Brevundimonas sp.]MBA4807057.1 hypothetical protein [Brevundimonas sp.]